MENTCKQDDRVSDPVALPPQNQTPASRPEFIRLPRSGDRCSLSGLSRATMNNLILGPKPPVKSICLRKRGAQKGVRLIVVQSLIDFLNSLEDEVFESEKDGDDRSSTRNAASPFRNN